MPRKPRQQRSRATVDAIIEAGFICVAEFGMTGTTTRHIAERAGISVGSLYEYFTNKGMVYEAMNQRLVTDVVAMIQPLLPQLMRMELTEAVRILLAHFGEFLKRNDERYLKCARQAMRVDIKGYLDPIMKILSELVMNHLMHHPENMRLRNIPAMSYVFINGGVFAVIRHLSDPNPPVSFEELTEGLANMVGHYVAYERLLAGLAAPPSPLSGS
ncbi:MAG: TetR/AcrR family transcriptional regulator [Fluviicoccus sp.]|uniref:TetR/AcrR family transcriptional regulator n=1 Tax=Fluviicoccus sp. TaxID=2003552 RepID=UPI0027176D73|nr:TetR/AcrR family transcriptional regulator [Fluviicoccus sp.]MDO8331439.1 TetR/AcrR family transcriptional regulator [Fluviicoccus sp.]